MIVLGRNLAKWRMYNGLTQDQLGRRLGLAQSTISNYERGEKIPNIHTLVKLARELHTTTDALLGLSNNCITINPKLLNKDDLETVCSICQLDFDKTVRKYHIKV